MARSSLILLFAGAAALGGCKVAARAKAPAAPVMAPLHLAPLTDLTAAAGLTWLASVRPREITQNADLIPAIAELIPEGRWAAFAEASGGVDLREPTELVVAGYGDSTLWLLATPVDPGRVERAFGASLLSVDGRNVDRASADPLGVVVRAWGTTSGHEQEELALFGHEAVALQSGPGEALRASELFASGKLRRASPALATAPLKRAAETLGEAPIRVFAPGPFTGDLASGLGGLLGAATAIAVRVRIVATGMPGRPGLACTAVLTGAWGNDATAAGERFVSSYDLLAASTVGRLLGAHDAILPARVRTTSDALTLEVTLDARALLAGLRDATGGTVDSIMGHQRRRSH